MFFNVQITRTGIKTVDFKVDADTPAEAQEKALEMAYNHDFGSDDSSDYEIVHVGHAGSVKNETPTSPADAARKAENENLDIAVQSWLKQSVEYGQLTVQELCELAVRYARKDPSEWATEMKKRLLGED